jgi:uncharacterized phage protein (TIGR01671 family)
MKEFKMKAWLKKEKKMVAVIGIDFNYEYIRYTEDGNLFNENYKTAEFKNVELLQYIGMKDKNNKEVYEGDILKLRDNHGIKLVKYHDEWSAFIVESQKDTSVGVLGLYFDKEEFEIIGNAYENSELLGE